MSGTETLSPCLPPGRFHRLGCRGRMWVWDEPGPVSAPAVLLLHGWTATAALNWYRSFEPLSHHFRVLAPDQRGHGRGIVSPWPFRLEDCADDAAELVHRLGIEHLVVVGYSMGGPVAQLMAKRHPELVSGLVLCATAQHFPNNRPGAWAFRNAAMGVSVAAGLVPPPLRRLALGPLLERSAKARDPWILQEWRRSDPVALAQAGLRLEKFDSRSWSSQVDIPTAVVITGADTRVSPSRQMALADAIPRSVRYVIDAGHLACVDQSDMFNAALLRACLEVSGS